MTLHFWVRKANRYIKKLIILFSQKFSILFGTQTRAPRINYQSAFAIFVIVAILFSNIVPFFGFIPRAQAVTYPFTQTNWTTADTISKATKATAVDSAWTKYVSKSTTISAGADVRLNLPATNQSFSDTTAQPTGPAGVSIKVGADTQRTDTQGAAQGVTGTLNTRLKNGPATTVTAGVTADSSVGSVSITINGSNFLIKPGDTKFASKDGGSLGLTIDRCYPKGGWCTANGCIPKVFEGPTNPSSATLSGLSYSATTQYTVGFKLYQNYTNGVCSNVAYSGNLGRKPNSAAASATWTSQGGSTGSGSFTFPTSIDWQFDPSRAVTWNNITVNGTSIRTSGTAPSTVTIYNDTTTQYTNVYPTYQEKQNVTNSKRIPTVGVYTYTAPLGLVYRSGSATPLFSSNPGAAYASWVWEPGYPTVSADGRTITYALRLSNSHPTISYTLSGVQFTFGSPPGQPVTLNQSYLVTPPYAGVVGAVSGTPKVSFSATPTNPADYSYDVTSISVVGGILNYTLNLSNASTQALTVSGVNFNLTLNQPVSGTLVASPFDMGNVSEGPVFTKLIWDEIIPDATKTKVKFQVRTSTDAVTWTSFVGPDNTNVTFFSNTAGGCSKDPPAAGFTNKVTCNIPTVVAQPEGTTPRFFQYQMILETTDSMMTPTVDNVTARYTINTAPTVTVTSASQSTVASTAGDVIINYSVSDDSSSSINADLFYDIGLKLDTALVQGATMATLVTPGGVNLQTLIPSSGVLLIEDEEIYYDAVSYNAVGSDALIKPIIRGYGPQTNCTDTASACTTKDATHVLSTPVYVRALTKTGTGSGKIYCPLGSTCSFSISWTPSADYPNQYKSSAQKVIVVVNDGEANRQIKTITSSLFTLDTKAPQLSSPPSLTEGAGIKLVSGYGYKTNLTSVLFSLGAAQGSGSTDNPNSNNYLSKCDASSCATPTGKQLLLGTASGWSAKAPLDTTYPYAVPPTGVKTISFTAFDTVANVSLFSSAAKVAYDNTPPPPISNFKAEDISSSLEVPAQYLTWTAPLWGTEKDQYGREDFGKYVIYRDKFTDAAGFCKTNKGYGLTPVGEFCVIDTETNFSKTNHVDTQVLDKTTYIYRIVTEDDVGNKKSPTDTGVPGGSGSVSVEGAPKIIPALDNVRKLLYPQSKYTDPIIIYWDSKYPSGDPKAGQPMASDSRVAFKLASSLPTTFDDALIQGSSELKSAGVIGADGTCNCHKIIIPINLTDSGVGVKPGQTYYFEVRSTAGSDTGKFTDASTYFTTLQKPADVLPQISNVLVNGVQPSSNPLDTSTSATITWSTDVDATSFVDYGLTTSFEKGSVGSITEEKTPHRVELLGLDAGTTYYFRVRSKAAGTNGGETKMPASGEYSFITKAQDPGDVTAPDIDESTIRACDIQANTAAICWETPGENSGSIVSFWEKENPTEGVWGYNPDPAERTRVHRVQLPANLTPDIFYEYIVRSPDDNGNFDPANESAPHEFKTLSADNLLSPIIDQASIHNDDPAPNSAIIRWITNVDSNSTVYYKKDDSSGLDSAQPKSDSTYTKNHVVMLIDLEPNKPYFYKVKSSNAVGYASATCSSGSCSFYTPPSSRPAPVIDLSSITVTTREKGAQISWKLSSGNGNSYVEVGTTRGYELGAFGNVSRPVIEMGGDTSTAQVTTINIPDVLQDETKYHFKISTVDFIGQSAQHPARSIEDDPGYIPTCDTDALRCLDPTFITVRSLFTTTAEVKEPLTITMNRDASGAVIPLLIGKNTAVVGWTTNRVSDSEVYYGTSATFGCLGGPCPVGKPYKTIGADGKEITHISALTRTHAVEITGLEANTPYYFGVASNDASIPQVRKEDNNNGLGYTFTTTAGTEAVSQAELDQVQSELDALKLEEQRLREQLADQTTLTAEEIAALQAQLNANLARQAELQGQITQQLQVDNVPPTITNVAISNITEESATITWDTNEEATSNVFYGETIEYDQLAGEGTSLFKKHTVVLSDLNPGTLYHFAAVSYDSSVNLAQSEDKTFTTKGVKGEKEEIEEEPGESAAERIKKLPPGVKLSLDKITALLKEFSEEEVVRVLNEAGLQLVSPPKFTGGEPVVTVTQTTATIKWKTDKNSDSRIAYKEHTAFDEKKENPYGAEVGDADVFAQEHEVVLENLQPGTRYHYQLRSREAAGRSAKSIDRTFTTKPITPEATSMVVADRTEHTATIKWKTNIPTKTSIEYKNLRTDKERSQGDTQFTTIHELTLIELDPDTKYEAAIRSENEAGVSAISKKFTFATKKDITPPEVSQVRTELSLVPGKSDVVQAVISWRTNEQTTGRVLYDEGLQKNRELKQSTAPQEDLSTAHVIVLSKLRPLTIYTFKVVAQDAAGNIGTSKEFKIITPRKERSVLELIISNFEDIFGFLRTL